MEVIPLWVISVDLVVITGIDTPYGFGRVLGSSFIHIIVDPAREHG